MSDLEFETAMLKGIFFFTGNQNSNFRSPIKKGFRPIAWIDTVNKASSCSFIFEGQINPGEKMEIVIVILNQLTFNQKIKKGTVINIGSTKDKIGEFIVTKHLGQWRDGKVP